ncbi:hypothetical protein V2J09_007993 [Rumex salicifolius]
MPGMSCNACNKEFDDDMGQKLHYKSEWHRYNLKRKIAGVPGVTEALFFARQAALAQEKTNQNETPMLYSCGICGKGYRSAKAHAQHLNSKNHVMRASQSDDQQNESNAIIKPLTRRVPVKPVPAEVVESEDSDESEGEWVEVHPGEDLLGEATSSLSNMGVNENIAENDGEGTDEDDEMLDELDPSCCFMCDLEHDTIENCMVHMHKKHGFFIPDVEFLKDPRGLLTYLGLKVKRDYMCLYCNERCHPFSSLEAVRKHMEAKRHCKVPFGDGGDDEEVELEEFYDYTSSYMDEDGKQLIAADDTGNSVELGGGELVIKRRTSNGMSTKSIGSREFLRYYKQKPKPSPSTEMAISVALASRYKSMGLATVQSKEHMVRMKVLKEMNRSGVEFMRMKMEAEVKCQKWET